MPEGIHFSPQVGRVSCLMCKHIFWSFGGLSTHQRRYHGIKPLEKRKANRLRCKLWYEKNKERALESRIFAIDKLREEVLSAYGNKCACCGETTREFLTVDHIYNDGAKERKMLIENGVGKKMTGWNFYFYLRRQGFPKERYQLLCANCNTGKHRCGGVCPHKGGQHARTAKM